MQIWEICFTRGVESRRMNNRREKVVPDDGYVPRKMVQMSCRLPMGQISEEIWEVILSICYEYLMPTWIMDSLPPRALEWVNNREGFSTPLLIQANSFTQPRSRKLFTLQGCFWPLICTSGIMYSVGKRLILKSPR